MLSIAVMNLQKQNLSHYAVICVPFRSDKNYRSYKPKRKVTVFFAQPLPSEAFFFFECTIYVHTMNNREIRVVPAGGHGKHVSL